jgi:cation:H+ antiporter
LLVGLTVVSYGTSAPELAVSLIAAVNDQSDIALGNVVGSNIANGALVLGLTAAIAPPRVPPRLWRLELPWLWAATLALPACLWDGRITQLEGALLAGASAAFTIGSLRAMRRGQRPVTVDLPASDAVGDRSERSSESAPRLAALVVGGLFALSLGGKCFVEGSVAIARVVGIDELTIGLTLVAFGTSLPELAASVVAALRGHSDLAVGNVLGSNLFNLLLILGAASCVRPILGDLSTLGVHLGFLLTLTLLNGLSMGRSRVISRLEGWGYVAVYAGFLGTLSVLSEKTS